ncbi:putative nuclear polyadenylated RNA-binding protein Nab2/ZC3H14 [Helianthus annuus]|nr:putative nuclear polyadenylated RNA-binding protein Nab2/ZC3H14 [Helianthus annuus]KAJ0773023.1 putative nuclear polyadenylated RNA-binding protein Nab2/ZC3H14 [Helianthus annuus]
MRLLKIGGRKEEVRNWMNTFLGNDKDSFVSWLWDHLQSNQDLYAQSKESHSDEVAKQKPQAQQAAVNNPAPQAQAQPDKPRSLIDTVNYLLCIEPCRNKVAQLRALNSKMMDDYNSAMTQCIGLRQRNKLLTEKVEAQKKDIAQLHLDLNQQHSWVHDYKTILNAKILECDSVRAELELLTGNYQQNELNMKKFDASSKVVQDMCDVQLAYKKNKGKGLGYNQVTPPYNQNYTRMSDTEEDLENEQHMVYGKPSDYTSRGSVKPVNAEVSGVSSDKPELFDPTKDDEVKSNVNKAPRAQTEQSESSVSDEKGQIKQQEPKRACKG